MHKSAKNQGFTRTNFAKQNLRGFTLVELLVVITIIAILATIGLVMYENAQKQARIAKRIEDLKAIQTALEIYYSVNKTYPVVTLGTDTVYRSECTGWGGYASDQVIPNPTGYPSFIPTYMAAFPSDPQSNGINRSCYIYRSNGTDYKIMDYNIAEFSQSDYLSQPNLIDTRFDGGSINCVYEPGYTIIAWSLRSSCQTTPSCSGGCIF